MPALTATTASTRCCWATPAASTARPAWGTYLWVEVENLKRLEAKIVEGPYIHHCVAIHANVVPVLYEACKYIGIVPDLYDPIEEDVKAYLRGE